MKRQYLFVLIISLISFACGKSAIPQGISTPSQPNVTPTSLPTATQTITPPSATPTPVPTQTLIPTPKPPRGTLGFRKTIGYGSGYGLSPYGLQLSADEKRLIATTTAGIFIFSAEDLSLLVSIYAPMERQNYPYLREIRVSRDGSIAAGFSSNAENKPTIKFWDLASGKLLGEYVLEGEAIGPDLTIANFDISPDNSQVAAVSKEGQILVISIPDGTITKTLDQYINNTQAPLWMEFDPTGKTAYYIFQDVSFTGVQTYGLNSSTWEEVSFQLADTIDFPWDSGAFAPQLSKPAGFKWGYFTRWGSHTLAAWDYSTFGKRFNIKRQDSISSIAFSPDGQWVVMGGNNPAQMEVWAVETVKAPEQIFAASRPLWAAAVSSGGQAFYGISNDGSLSMWKSGEAEPVHRIEGFLPAATDLAFTEDGLGLQLIRSDYEIFEINPEDGVLRGIYPDPNILDDMNDKTPVSMTVNADKSMLAAVYFSLDDYAIRLFDLKTGKLIRKIPSKGRLRNIGFAPDGLSLFTYGPKQPVRVLDIQDGKVLQTIKINENLGGDLFEMLLSRDKSTLVLYGETGVIEIYRTDTMELVQTLDSVSNIGNIAISDDGSMLAYYNWEGLMGLWDIDSNTVLPQVDSNYPTIVPYDGNLAFSPDNRTLAFSTWDGVIRLFDVAP